MDTVRSGSATVLYGVLVWIEYLLLRRRPAFRANRDAVLDPCTCTAGIDQPDWDVRLSTGLDQGALLRQPSAPAVHYPKVRGAR